jgi:hypothetical protein
VAKKVRVVGWEVSRTIGEVWTVFNIETLLDDVAKK